MWGQSVQTSSGCACVNDRYRDLNSLIAQRGFSARTSESTRQQTFGRLAPQMLAMPPHKRSLNTQLGPHIVHSIGGNWLTGFLLE